MTKAQFERLAIERKELSQRYRALDGFISRGDEVTLPVEQRKLLEAQRGVMKAYLGILDARIDLIDIRRLTD